MQLSPRNNNEFPFPHAVFGFVATMFIILFYSVGSGYVVFALAPNGNIEANPMAIRVAQVVGQLLFMLLPAIAITRLSPLGMRGLLRFETSNIQPKHWIVVFVGLISIQVFTSGWMSVQDAILPSSLAEWMQQQSESLQQIYSVLLSGNGLFSLVTALAIGALVPAVSEEILFRGVLQRSLEQRLGIPVAIVHTSMLFTFIHFNVAQFIPLLVLSVILATVAATSQSLLPTIVMHFLNNALAVFSLHISAIGSINTESAHMELSVAIPLTLISLGMIIGCIWMLLRKPPVSAIPI